MILLEPRRSYSVSRTRGLRSGLSKSAAAAPARMPLYATMLEELMAVQRTVKKAAGIGH